MVCNEELERLRCYSSNETFEHKWGNNLQTAMLPTVRYLNEQSVCLRTTSNGEEVSERRSRIVLKTLWKCSIDPSRTM